MKPSTQSFQMEEYRGIDQRSTTPVQPLQKTMRSRWEDFYWTIEILSCLFAAIILVALVAVLAIFNGHQQPNWPHPVSINTIIAVFTVAFKALLLKPVVEGLSQCKWLWFSRPKELSDLELFDQATRGPWGSTCLLFDSFIKSRRSYLTIFGALLTIVALAIDPLSQGIVRYFSCAKPSSDTVAQIPRTNNYTAVGGWWGTGSYELDAPMTVALYTGLLDPPNSSTVPITCPTGNCTFPAAVGGASFSSISMCSSCRDITTTIISEQTLKRHTLWTLRLPSGPRLEGVLTSVQGPEPVFNSSPVALVGTETFAFEALMLKEDKNCESKNNTDNNEVCSSHDHSRQRSFAIRCSLEPCVKTYHANVSRSDYQESCLKTERLEPYYQSTVLANKTTLRNGTWEDCSPSSEATEINTFQYNKSTTGDYTPSNYSHDEPLWYPPDCVWVFGYNANRSILAFLGPQWLASLTLSYDGKEPSGSLWIKNLWKNGTATMSTVNASMEGLALAMTSQMRQSPDSTEKLRFVTGTVHESVTCVEVRWIWLLYPIIALFLTVVFLALAIFQGRATHQPWHNDWKSSSLALLFHGLEPETREKYGAVPKQKDMIEAAEKIRVQLVQGEEGWRFSEARQPADEEDGMAAGVPGEAHSDTTSLNTLGRPSLRVSQTSTASLLAPSVSYDSAIPTPRSQSPQASPRRSTTI